jgi:superfamily I DNA and/or RNA helicase
MNLEETTCPLLLYDTSSAGLNEESEASTASGSLSGFAQESTLNPGEANLVLDHLLTLLNAGVPASSIIVITPYSAQVRHIKLSLQSRAASATSPSSKESLFSQIEVGTVDAFQGSERDAVLLSLVRSNEDREVGFLGDERRLNVAVTRARRHLAVFADVRCLSGGGGAFLKGFLAFVEDHGLVRFVE